MDENERLTLAHLKNLRYLQRQTEIEHTKVLEKEQQTSQPTSSSSSSNATSKKKRKRDQTASIYITGLPTYIACQQLEALAQRIGKVRRIKFYKDSENKNKLKGDALITFHYQEGIVQTALDQIDNCQILPGIYLKASVAEFNLKPPRSKKQIVDYSSQVSRHIQLFQLPLSDETSLEALERDLQALCRPFGTVEDLELSIEEESSDLKPESVTDFVSALISFAHTCEAIQCVQKLNGYRFLYGSESRSVEIGANFNFQKETPHIQHVDEADEDVKLQAFFASIDDAS